VTTPLQLPPQDVPSLAQAARAPWGAPATGLHVPTLPATLQASHCPPQATLQHTPSTHCPVPHWFAALQAAPGPTLGRHVPPEHQEAALQSASPPQVPRQAVAPHAYGAQVSVCTAGQAPVPLQAAASVPTPAAQEAPRQEVAAPG
jgi:hypothetical protein